MNHMKLDSAEAAIGPNARVNDMLNLAEIIDVGGRAFMLTPVHDWMIPMIDETAAEARKGAEFPNNGFK